MKTLVFVLSLLSVTTIVAVSYFLSVEELRIFAYMVLLGYFYIAISMLRIDERGTRKKVYTSRHFKY